MAHYQRAAELSDEDQDIDIESDVSRQILVFVEYFIRKP